MDGTSENPWPEVSLIMSTECSGRVLAANLCEKSFTADIVAFVGDAA